MKTQNNTAKKIVIGLMLLAVISYFIIPKMLPRLLPDINAGVKEQYKSYKKTNATIVSIKTNGQVGKNASNICTIQYADLQGKLQTIDRNEPDFQRNKVNDIVIIYYDTLNSGSIATQSTYDFIMKL
jgi:hypothetical protein